MKYFTQTFLIGLVLCLVSYPAHANCIIMQSSGLGNLISTVCLALGAFYLVKSIVSFAKSLKKKDDLRLYKHYRKKISFHVSAAVVLTASPFLAYSLFGLSPYIGELSIALCVIALLMVFVDVRLEYLEQDTPRSWVKLLRSPFVLLACAIISVPVFVQGAISWDKFQRKINVGCCVEDSKATFKCMSPAICNETGKYVCGEMTCYTCDDKGNRLYPPKP